MGRPVGGAETEDRSGLQDSRATAKRLGVSERWLEDRVQRREIPHRRLGRRVLFSDEDIQQIIAEAGVRAQPRGRRAV